MENTSLIDLIGLCLLVYLGVKLNSFQYEFLHFFDENAGMPKTHYNNNMKSLLVYFAGVGTSPDLCISPTLHFNAFWDDKMMVFGFPQCENYCGCWYSTLTHVPQ